MSSKAKTTATKEAATSALVPKLRFPEFRGKRAWEPTTLNAIADPVTVRAVQGDEDNVLSLSAEHGIVLQSEFFGKKVAGDNSERYLKIARNDFVYNDRTTKASTFGTIKRLSKHAGGIVSPIYKCFRFQSDEDPVFWEWYFESGTHNPALAGLVNEGARAGRFNISITQFLSTSAWRPAEPEQQKIAECLNSVDELMAAQARKVDALKTHKKGLMQQLFPCERETQPRLRFPEFEEGGPWQEKALGGLSTTTIGEFVIKTKQRPDAPYPVFNGGRSQTGFYDQYNNEGNKILISARGANAGHVNIIKQRYWAGNSCYSVSLNDPRDSLDFVYWFMKQNERAFTDNQHAANIPAVSKGHVESFKIMLPSPEEQQRIATCLSSLDALITAETQKHEALKTHKNGLMQQLFPSPEEVEA